MLRGLPKKKGQEGREALMPNPVSCKETNLAYGRNTKLVVVRPDWSLATTRCSAKWL